LNTSIECIQFPNASSLSSLSKVFPLVSNNNKILAPVNIKLLNKCCPSGTYRNSGTHCLPCQQGKISSGVICDNCYYGQIGVVDHCFSCPPGSYNDQIGMNINKYY